MLFTAAFKLLYGAPLFISLVPKKEAAESLGTVLMNLLVDRLVHGSPQLLEPGDSATVLFLHSHASPEFVVGPTTMYTSTRLPAGLDN